jgi:hypothetical protein
MLGVTATLPAELPAKHHTPQDEGVPVVCQATQFPVLSPKTQAPWLPVTGVPAANCSAAARAAAALPAALQSKNVCPCPLSCSIWQVPPGQHSFPAGQQVAPQVRPVVQTQVPPEHV